MVLFEQKLQTVDEMKTALEEFDKVAAVGTMLLILPFIRSFGLTLTVCNCLEIFRKLRKLSILILFDEVYSRTYQRVLWHTY